MALNGQKPVPAGVTDKVALLETATGNVLLRHPCDAIEIVTANEPGAYEVAIQQDYATSEGRQGSGAIQHAINTANILVQPKRALEIAAWAKEQPGLAKIGEGFAELGEPDVDVRMLREAMQVLKEMKKLSAPEPEPIGPKGPIGQDATTEPQGGDSAEPHQDAPAESEAAAEPAVPAGVANDDDGESKS